MTTFIEELRQRSLQRAPARRRNASVLVSFLTIRDDVALALDAGYAKKTIWAYLHEVGRAPYRYETFLRHVNKRIPEASRAMSNQRHGRAK